MHPPSDHLHPILNRYGPLRSSSSRLDDETMSNLPLPHFFPSTFTHHHFRKTTRPVGYWESAQTGEGSGEGRWVCCHPRNQVGNEDCRPGRKSRARGGRSAGGRGRGREEEETSRKVGRGRAEYGFRGRRRRRDTLLVSLPALHGSRWATRAGTSC